DTFVITGDASYEIFRFNPAEDAQNLYPDLVLRGAATEIVLTRTVVTNGVVGTPQVIAELTEIEEIVINGTAASGVGEANGDRYELIGDFAEQGEETSLRLNTITINGSDGDDTVDISKLTSAHRIVFRTKGGNDTIFGTLRPQDVVLLPTETTVDDYDVVQNVNGTTTLVGDDYSVTFLSPSGLPQFATDDGHQEYAPPSGAAGVDAVDDEDDIPIDDGDHEEDDEEDDHDHDHDDDDDDQAAPVSGNGGDAQNPILGTSAANHLNGTNGRDVIFAGAGDDIVLGGKGA